MSPADPPEAAERAQAVLDLVDTVLRSAGDLTRLGDRIAGRHDQTAARSLVLGALATSPGSIAEVARRRGLRRQSVQETMRRLEDEGLVHRVAASSRRSPTFRLTGAGAVLQQALHTDYLDWATGVAERLDTTALHAAAATLLALFDGLEAGEPRDGAGVEPGGRKTHR